MVNATLKRIVPEPVIRARRRWNARRAANRTRRQRKHEFRLDSRRYDRHAAPGEFSFIDLDAIQLEAQLTRDYHRVEKGLALGAPKRPFGQAVLRRIDEYLPVAQTRMPESALVTSASSARDALRTWNSGGSIDDAVAPLRIATTDRGCDDPDRFFTSRHSVRDFTEQQVDMETVRRAVALAGRSPSVCNRQPWKVRLYEGADVAGMLQYQNGNRGFASVVPSLVLVSVELGHFAGPGERNQAWIEGGIFASSLVWALHALNLEACMLNLSVVTADADRLRAAAGMSESEVPIMMIAIGHAPEEHRVARSPRRTVDQLVVPAPRS